jgi:hypothetical protein
MYKTFLNNELSNESFVNIIHFLIGVLIKYKYIISSEVSIDTLPSTPKGSDLTVAHDFLKEINATNLINDDEQLNMHVQNLYKLLKSRMEKSLNTDEKNGEALLNRLREE